MSGFFKISGTLEKWQEAAAYAEDNHVYTFSLCVSLSGVLLRRLGMLGVIISITGPTGAGKTTMVEGSSSIWGSIEQILTWKTTDNALEGLAVQFMDNVLYLDEVGICDAQVLSKIVYMLASGTGKNRMNQKCEVKEPKRWVNMVFSTGELGLKAKLEQGNLEIKGGQEVRFIEVPVDKDHFQNLHGFKDAAALVAHLKSLWSKNYGLAGRAFVEWLTSLEDNRWDEFRNRLNNLSQEFSPPEADVQVIRVGRYFALIALAGELGIESGVFPKTLDPKAAALHCFRAWLEYRGGVESSDEMKLVTNVKYYLQTNEYGKFKRAEYDNRLIVDEEEAKRVMTSFSGYVVYEIDHTKFYILEDVFNKDVVKGYEPKLALNILSKYGLFEKPNGRNCVRLSPENLGRTNFIVIKLGKAETVEDKVYDNVPPESAYPTIDEEPANPLPF